MNFPSGINQLSPITLLPFSETGPCQKDYGEGGDRPLMTGLSTRIIAVIQYFSITELCYMETL